MQRSGEAETGRAPGPAPIMTPTQLRALKIAVLGMGVLLVLGFLVIVGRIVYLLGRPSASADVSGRPVQIELPRDAVIRSQSLSGQRLSVHFEAPDGAGFAIIDLTGAAPPQMVRIVPKDQGQR